MRRAALVLLPALALSACGAPVAVVAGALGVAGGVLRVDEKVLDLWLQSRGETRVPAPAPEEP